MKKNVWRVFAILVLVIVSLSSCKKKEQCLKVQYKMDGVEVVTYQYMTREEADLTFSEFEDVRIFDTKDEKTDCLMNNTQL